MGRQVVGKLVNRQLGRLGCWEGRWTGIGRLQKLVLKNDS